MFRLLRGMLLCLSCLFVFGFGVPPIHAQAASVDSDGDGLNDSWELQVFQTDPNNKDSDGDRFDDRTELVKGYNPNGSGVLKDADYDQDGLSNRRELLFAADPISKDSDGDGFADGAEVEAGFSPTSTSKTALEKRILIKLSNQTMQQILGGVVLQTYSVSTGKKGWVTPVGEFTVMKKHPRAWSRAAGLWMPWWMQFSNRGYGIHELPEWPGGKKEGANHLGTPASHGCVRLGVGPAKVMYDWATSGTRISIVK